jgi:glycosyltransferase involved in cell wall biosynthesis
MAYATGIEQNLVSVIVPAHNAEKFLADALASIFAQDYRPIEVIVVDDGSTDGTATIAQAYTDVRYVFQKKQGAAAARNAGLAICRGALIAFLDADDLWAPNKLSRQTAYLDGHPEAVCVSGKMRNFLEPETECPAWVEPGTLVKSVDVPSFCTILARRSLFEAVGSLNNRYLQGEDLEWFFRVKESGIQVHTINETVLLRRIHPGNISHNLKTQAQMLLRMLKESIDRKRAAAATPPSEARP